MLTFDWDDIKQNGLVLECREDVSSWPELQALQEEEECRFLAPLEVKLHVYPAGDMLEVAGEFRTELEVDCYRCLSKFSMDLEGSFEMSLAKDLPSVEDEDGAEIELSADEMGLTLVDEKSIDLKLLVAEQILLAYPYRALCAENCKGVCATCGTDLNLQSCHCRQDNPLNKFTLLKDLKIPK